MINEEITLTCGTELRVLQPEPNGMLMLRITAVNRPLDSIAQVKDNRITVAIDPVVLPELEMLFRKIFKPTPWDKFLIFLKGK